MNRESIISFDGKSISVATWGDFAVARGIVQLSHGLAEHIARYDEFAEFLVSNGYAVIGDDHRGHGLTDKNALGLAVGANIFEDTVRDMLLITDTFSKRFDLPIVVLGHSYGSFLTRRYITLQKSQVVRGYILSGTAYIGGFELALGRMLANGKSKRQRDLPAKTIIRNSFKKYDKKIGEGKNDWLSRNLIEVGKYNIDPLCGFAVSYGFYKHFFDGIKTINQKKTVANNSVKTLLASGGRDMFGGSGKLTAKVYKNYCKQGQSPILKLYENARHEILNETNKVEVYQDFLDFINTCFD